MVLLSFVLFSDYLSFKKSGLVAGRIDAAMASKMARTPKDPPRISLFANPKSDNPIGHVIDEMVYALTQVYPGSKIGSLVFDGAGWGRPPLHGLSLHAAGSESWKRLDTLARDYFVNTTAVRIINYGSADAAFYNVLAVWLGQGVEIYTEGGESSDVYPPSPS